MAYIVHYRTVDSPTVRRVATFHSGSHRNSRAYSRALAFMRGIDQSGGIAGMPEWDER